MCESSASPNNTQLLNISGPKGAAYDMGAGDTKTSHATSMNLYPNTVIIISLWKTPAVLNQLIRLKISSFI